MLTREHVIAFGSAGRAHAPSLTLLVDDKMIHMVDAKVSRSLLSNPNLPCPTRCVFALQSQMYHLWRFWQEPDYGRATSFTTWLVSTIPTCWCDTGAIQARSRPYLPTLSLVASLRVRSLLSLLRVQVICNDLREAPERARIDCRGLFCEDCLPRWPGKRHEHRDRRHRGLGRWLAIASAAEFLFAFCVCFAVLAWGPVGSSIVCLK